MASNRPRAGAALIEALISLVLLGTAGVTLLMLLTQTRETLHSAFSTEELTERASAELGRMVVSDRAQLLDRVGWTVRRGLAVHLEAESSGLFDVTVAREPGGVPLLQTTLYRPDSADAR